MNALSLNSKLIGLKIFDKSYELIIFYIEKKHYQIKMERKTLDL